jgi:sec-independent protein translocase protein TatA
MQLGSIGVPEMLVIVLVVLPVFGPRRLPAVARGMARAARELRQGLEHGLEPSAEERTAAASWGCDARPHAAGGRGVGEGNAVTTAAPPPPTGEEQPGR